MAYIYRFDCYLSEVLFIFSKAYTVMVRVMDEMEDSHPAVLERRYNDFLSLYNALRKDFAIQLSTIPFPKKTIVGNFSPEVISSRCTGFEAFLDLIGSTTQIRCCEAVTSFFQERELIDALKLIRDKQYYQVRLSVSYLLLNIVHLIYIGNLSKQTGCFISSRI